MLPPSRDRKPPVLPGSLRLVCALLLACAGPAGRAPAGGPPGAAACPPAGSSFPPCLPPAPDKPPRPPAGPESVAAFLEGIGHNDAAFEVLVGQGRILTTKGDLAVAGKPEPLIAIGDPSVADFIVLNNRQIRVIGLRLGLTDLSITTGDNKTYTFEVRVVADLHVLRGKLHCLFPDASLKLTQIRDHVVVEGEARDAVQVARILETIRAYLASVQAAETRKTAGLGRAPLMPPADRPGMPEAPMRPEVPPAAPGQPEAPPAVARAEAGIRTVQGTVIEPQVINLLKVPGSKQVLLKVRVAELNRSALRQIGADFLISDGNSIIGTQIGGAAVLGNGTVNTGGLNIGTGSITTTPSTTVFGIFGGADFNLFLSALRRNSMVKILAEPNLIALNGQAASFLAGGEFPVPTSQPGGGGVTPAVTVTFKEFGVQLGFVPTILDGDVIRLSVDPEVSNVDFSIGAVLVPGGSPVPGVNTRRVHTVVELREGQTLAIAGLLSLTMDGTTTRIPGLGDLPVLGPFFSNTTGSRIEKELLVLVTPYLIEPQNHGQVPPSPGEEVNGPTDFEFYFLNRIEGRLGVDWRATTEYPQPLQPLQLLRCLLRLEDEHVRGPHGFCE